MEYFYNKPSLITEDYYEEKIGIVNEIPQYTLDVTEGTLGFSNAFGSNIFVDTLAFSNALGSNLVVVDTLGFSNAIGYDLQTNTIDSIQISANDIDASSNLQGRVFNATSNICWGGNSLYDPYPGDPTDWDELIPFSGDLQGMIDVSWIRKPLSAKDVLTDLFGLAENAIDIAEVVADIYSWLNPQQQIAQSVIDALREALDQNPESPDAIKVSWHNLLDVPVAKSNDIGIKGDVFCADAQSLKVIPASQFSRNAQNNLQLTTGNADTLLDFGTKEIYLKSFNVGANVRVTDTDSNFKFHNWVFTSNSLSNANIIFVPTICNLTACNITTDIISNASNCIMLSSNYSVICHSQNSKTSYTKFYNDTLEFSTMSNNIETLQFSSDVSGNLFSRSGVLMPEIGVIRAYQSPSIDNDFYREGILRVAPDSIRFLQSSNASEKIWWSYNSNGMFLNNRFNMYGKLETIQYPNPIDPLQTISVTDFPRLDVSLTNGLVFGWGLDYSLANLNIFNISKDGELFTKKKSSSTMIKSINSEGEIEKGNLKLTNDGNLQIKGSNVITLDGAIIRRVDPAVTTGFQVSPSGYLTVGGLQVATDGVLISTKGMTASNVTASNITCSNLTASNIGIGILSPTEVLHVVGNVRANSLLNTGNLKLSLSNASQNNNYSMRFENVNYGSNSSVYLDLKPQQTDWGTGHVELVGWGYSNGVSRGAQPIRITSRLGVGMSNPGYPLDVSGSMNATTLYEGTTSLINKYSLLTQGDWSSNTLFNCRRNADQVPWSSISNPPNFNIDASGNFDSMSVAGMTLGAAGLVMGGTALLNQNGQLTSALATVSDKLKLNPTGYSKFDDGLNIGPSLSLDPLGGLSATSAKFGLNSITLSNNVFAITDVSGNPNILLSSNLSYFKCGKLGIGTNNPAYGVDVSGSLNATTLYEGTTSLINKYATSNFAFNNSNLLFPQASFASNLGVSSSNILFPQASFASNLGVSSSNILFPQASFASNLGVSSSNILFPQSLFGCNVGVYASNSLVNYSSTSHVHQNTLWTTSGTSVYTNSNVGIGTASPTGKFHIYGGSTLGIIQSVDGGCIANSAPTQYMLQCGNYELTNQLYTGILARSYNSTGSGIYSFSDRAYVGMGFVVRNGNSSNIEAMNIRNNGDVGIGFSNPSYKLDVNGTARATAIMEGTSNLSDKYALSNHIFPIALFGSNNSVTANSCAIFGSNTSAFSSNQHALTGWALGVSGIATSCNVAVSDLRVAGHMYWAPTKNLVCTPTANNHEFSVDLMNQNTYTGNSFMVWSDKTGLGSLLAVRGDTGNVGIGTSSPTHSLQTTGNMCAYTAVAGNIGWANMAGFAHCNQATSTNYALLQDSAGTTYLNTPTSCPIIFSVNDVAKMRVHSDGKVGIGTASPGYQLHVAGNAGVKYSLAIREASYGIYLENAAGDKYWRINHDLSETDDNMGNMNFYVGDGGEYNMCYIEDDNGVTKRLNFTACHKCVAELPIDVINDVGLIVVASGKYNSLLPDIVDTQKLNIEINEALPTVQICTQKKDKRVFGVIAGKEEYSKTGARRFTNGAMVTCVRRNGLDDLDRVEINALGEGGIYVTDTAGNFENGDFIQSSDLSGYGEKQKEDNVCSFTVAKITCNVDWKDPDLSTKFQTRIVNNHKCAFVGCIYKCG